MENSTRIEPGDRVVVTDPASTLHGQTMVVKRATPEGAFLSSESSTATAFLTHDHFQLLKANATTTTGLVRIKDEASARWGESEEWTGRSFPIEAHDNRGVFVRSPRTGHVIMFLWEEVMIDAAVPLQQSPAPQTVTTAVLTEECMAELVDRIADRVADRIIASHSRQV